MSFRTALSSSSTASSATFSGDALTDLLAGLAANSIGSFVTSGSQSNPKKTHDRFSIAVFCGFGLLVSLTVLLLDQYIPSDWF
jgi:hypothetical protein